MAKARLIRDTDLPVNGLGQGRGEDLAKRIADDHVFKRRRSLDRRRNVQAREVVQTSGEAGVGAHRHVEGVAQAGDLQQSGEPAAAGDVRLGVGDAPTRQQVAEAED